MIPDLKIDSLCPNPSISMNVIERLVYDSIIIILFSCKSSSVILLEVMCNLCALPLLPTIIVRGFDDVRYLTK